MPDGSQFVSVLCRLVANMKSKKFEIKTSQLFMKTNAQNKGIENLLEDDHQ